MKKLFTKMSIRLMLLSAFFIIANSAQAASYFYGAVYFGSYLPAGFYDIVVSSQTKNVKYISQCWITDTSYNVNGARENCALAFWPVNINIFVIQ